MRYSRTIRSYPPPDAEYQLPPPPPPSEHHAFVETFPQLWYHIDPPELASFPEDISPPKVEWTDSEVSESGSSSEPEDKIESTVVGVDTESESGAVAQGAEPRESEAFNVVRNRRYRPVRIRIVGQTKEEKAGKATKKARTLKKLRVKKSRKGSERDNVDNLENDTDMGVVSTYNWSKLEKFQDPADAAGQPAEFLDVSRFATLEERLPACPVSFFW